MSESVDVGAGPINPSFEATEAMTNSANPLGNHPLEKSWASVVFSLAGGFVWASWPGTEAAVKLGECAAVSAMMQDFLDQNALGERMERNAMKP